MAAQREGDCVQLVGTWLCGVPGEQAACAVAHRRNDASICGGERCGSRSRRTTHDAGHRLTAADFDLAQRIDAIAEAHMAEPVDG
ncbi:hypothetical protein [Streptomyces sp. NBC_01538]|uniref:hypothetical protein n=1 Tax=Streptomyces sp. NBC_01538 TaxID=2903897 RepID=UPI00387008D5